MKTMKVDMSPEAITGRMIMLDQLWVLGLALKKSRLGDKVELADRENGATNPKRVSAEDISVTRIADFSRDGDPPFAVE
jgi:hypothetical protein